VDRNGDVVISVPPRELSGVSLPGSIFDISTLTKKAASQELRAAIAVLEQGWKKSPGRLQGLVRPEIFTHGASLEWLQKRLPNLTDHICMTDGLAMKLMPGVDNHLFPYALGSTRRHLEFKKLLRRAPELISQFKCQINSFRSLVNMGRPIYPPARHVPLQHPHATDDTVWYHDFYLNRHSLEDSAERMLEWGVSEPPPLEKFKTVIYLPLTDCAAGDRPFQKAIAQLITQRYFDPTSCLLIRVPSPDEERTELTARMIVALDGIRAGGLRLPQVRSKNILFTSGDCTEKYLRTHTSDMHLVVHETMDHWRYTNAFYRSVAQVTYFLEDERRSGGDPLDAELARAFDGVGKLNIVRRPINPAFHDD